MNAPYNNMNMSTEPLPCHFHQPIMKKTVRCGLFHFLPNNDDMRPRHSLLAINGLQYPSLLEGQGQTDLGPATKTNDVYYSYCRAGRTIRSVWRADSNNRHAAHAVNAIRTGQSRRND